ncbi:MAG: glycosyltransferase family 39 protein [Candidatus Binatia bacterium]
MIDSADRTRAEPEHPETRQPQPGSAGTPAARRWLVPATGAAALVVIAAWVGLQLWGLGKAPFFTKGEPREGLVVWEMTHGGGWILPKRNGVELPSKPPLFHWLAAVTALARGATDEWSIRFPSAALSLLALLCVLATGAALWSARAGLISALVLMTTFEWARAATNGRVDMALTFGLELALLSLLFFQRRRTTGWLIPLYAGMTVAVLSKGPVGAALPLLVALATCALTRDVGLVRQMRLGHGLSAVSVVAGSWYVMALRQGGVEFFRKQALAENVFTFFNSGAFGGGHRHSVAYLFGTLVLGLLPWTLFLPGVGGQLWRARRELSTRDCRVYLLVWIGVVFGFYALAASKRSVYLLALYPAVALLLGWWWNERTGGAGGADRWLARLLRAVGWPLLGTGLLLLAVVLLESAGAPVLATTQPWLPARAQPFAPWISDAIRSGSWLLAALLLLGLAGLYGCIRAARAAHRWWIFVFTFCTVASLLMAVREVILPGIARHQSVRTFMADVRHVTGPAGEVSFYRTFDYAAVFYWAGHIPTYDGPLLAGAPRYLLMTKAEWHRRRAAARDHYEQIHFRGHTRSEDGVRLVLVRRVQAP